jgi:undecaprenyl-diphosphatase
VLFSGIALALTDQLSSNFLKHAIERIRPCHVLDGVNLLVGCGGGYAMPSSHAANAFGQAALFGFFYRRVRWPLTAVAFLVAISRVLVGVHYPFDVLAGAALGGIIGIAVASAYRKTAAFLPGVMKRPGEET